MTTKPRELGIAGPARLAEIIAAYLQASDEGRGPDRDELLDRHPELAAELTEFFADQDQFDRLMSPFRRRRRRPVLHAHRSRWPAGGALGPRFGDYELIEEIAPGWHGRGLQGAERPARPHRGAQDDPGRTPGDSRRRRSVPRPRPERRPARPPEHRADLRGRGARGPALFRHEADRGGQPGRGPVAVRR